MHFLAEESVNFSVVAVSAASAIIVASANLIFQVILDRRSHKQRVRYETRFQTMHEKQSAAMQDIYSKMEYSYFMLTEYVEDASQDAEQQSWKSVREFSESFGVNQLLLPQSVAGRIVDIVQLLRTTHLQYRAAVKKDEANRLTADSENYIAHAMDELTDAIKPRMHEIRDTFRKMMSVEDETWQLKNKGL